MSGFIRRVVTGHDSNGKSIVLSDGMAPVVNRNRTFRRGLNSTDVWLTQGMPVVVRAEEPDPTVAPSAFVVAGGTKMRINEMDPEPPEIRKLPLDQAMVWLKPEEKAPASAHAALHRTRTVDYAVVLEGEITMYLDDKELLLKTGDVVIQRGTPHAWRNRSDRKVRMLFILLDAKFDDELVPFVQGDH